MKTIKTKFNNALECQNWIENIQRFSDKLDLHRMILACKLLGNPELKFKTIHIGGTNGKGSTTNYIKNILSDANFKVGTFTSPFVVSFNERITLNSDYISDEDLIKYTNIIYELWHKVKDEYNEVITFFEVLTLISFLYFKDKEVDYVVYEVGLGGKLDATNVIKPEIAGITNISYDHMKVLGDTLEEIALNKLGIVKEGIPLITTEENLDVLKLFTEYTKNKNSELYIVNHNEVTNIEINDTTKFTYKGNKYELNMLGYHQVKNAVLTIDLVNVLKEKEKLNISTSNIYNGLRKTFWPGRFEKIGNIILDGAHNIGGINSLKESMNIYKDKHIKCMFCMMEDKETSKVINILDSFVDEIHFTAIDYQRSTSAIKLYNLSNNKNKFYDDNSNRLLQKLTNLKENEILLITGSLYFISNIRKLLK